MYQIDLTEQQGREWLHEERRIANAARAAIITRARKIAVMTQSDVEITCNGEILEIVSLHTAQPCPRCGTYLEDHHHPICYSGVSDRSVGETLWPEGRTLDE